MCVYLVFIVAAEHVAGGSGFVPNQAAEVTRLLAVVDEFGDAMRPLLKQDSAPQWVPHVLPTRHAQNTPHPGTRDPQDHRTIAYLEARETGYYMLLQVTCMT